MNSEEFGKLVRALREELINKNGTKWTQVQLAANSGLSLNIIRNVENGRKASVTRDELVALANAFKLNSAERKEFFTCASAPEPEDFASSATVENVQKQLDELIALYQKVRLPFYIIDNYYDVICANQSAIMVFDLREVHRETTGENIGDFNHLWGVFDKSLGYRKLMGEAYERHAKYHLRMFREKSLSVRHKPYYKALLEYFRRFPDFRFHSNEFTYLYETGEHFGGHFHYRYRYPPHIYNGINVEFNSTETRVITPFGSLYVIIYVPCSKTTEQFFSMLADDNGCTVHRLAPWPNKPISG